MPKSDAEVERAVLDELRHDRVTSSLPVGVDVFDRIVFVHGAVPDVGSLGELAEVIQRVPEIAEVIDELDVGSPAKVRTKKSV